MEGEGRGGEGRGGEGRGRQEERERKKGGQGGRGVSPPNTKNLTPPMLAHNAFSLRNVPPLYGRWRENDPLNNVHMATDTTVCFISHKLRGA
jgi:hypothetical protein